MNEFLGILFAGGKGTRLGQITRYISKAFVPVYDRPVFMYPLAQLEASRHLKEIVILTNQENDAKLRETGYPTVIQDDDQVYDMLSGLRFLRQVLATRRHCVLMPCDNISDVAVDDLIDTFGANDCEVCFSLTAVADPAKLREMGVFDPATGKLVYKPPQPPSGWGMIAPYVVKGDFVWQEAANDAEVFNQARACYRYHNGYWFDIGDPESLVNCSHSLVSGVLDFSR